VGANNLLIRRRDAALLLPIAQLRRYPPGGEPGAVGEALKGAERIRSGKTREVKVGNGRLEAAIEARRCFYERDSPLQIAGQER
jgi:hypothetical protein